MKSVFKYAMIVWVLLFIIGLIVPAGALAAKEIKIGAIYPLTGGSTGGRSEKWGHTSGSSR